MSEVKGANWVETLDDVKEQQHTLVLYHARCMDGLGAAYAASLHFGDEAAYIPVQYNDTKVADFEAVLQGRDVYVLDFSFTMKQVSEMLDRGASSVCTLDHHRTFAERWGLNPEQKDRGLIMKARIRWTYDPHRSGARIAWDHFEEGDCRLIDYIQDRDLWQWKLPGSRAVSAYLHSAVRTLADMHRVWDLDIEELIERGEMLLAQTKAQVDRIVNDGHSFALFQGVPAVYCNSPVYQSEVGEALYTQYPSRVAVVWSQRNNHLLISLRSKSGEGPSVQALAEALGGGGHAHAAGARIPLNQVSKKLGEWPPS